MRNLLLGFISLGSVSPLCVRAATLHVGSTATYKIPCAAFAVASDGERVLIDSGLTGIFLNIRSADTRPTLAQGNIFYGGGALYNQSNTTFSGDFFGNPSFASLTNYNYNLNAGPPAINYATSEETSSEGCSLVPASQFLSPTCVETRQNAIDAGEIASP